LPFVGLKVLKPTHYLKAKVTEAGKLETQLNAYYRLDERVDALTDSLARKPEQELIGLVADLLEDAVAGYWIGTPQRVQTEYMLERFENVLIEEGHDLMLVYVDCSVSARANLPSQCD